MPPSTPLSRFLLRLRERALRGYEIFLFALLVAMALLAAMPADSSAADDDVHCGNAQSKAVVITR